MKKLTIALALMLISNSLLAMICQETGDFCNDYLDCCDGSCVANVCVSSFVDFNKSACVATESQCQEGSLCCSEICEDGRCL